ncbi:MAG: hypothetical protein R3293_28235, partial [Candidatus Promineifilaceae bacterium]|nr:hypothetical protein [Candidatus Promineifilaceae bacterium]
MIHRTVLLLIFIAGLTLSACLPAPGAGQVEEPTMTDEPPPATAEPGQSNSEQTTPTPEPLTPTPEPTPTPADALPQTPVERAAADLARRLKIGVDQITVREARAVVWPDAGLGCPQPGMAYAQVQQEGMLIRLHAAGALYFYHSGADGQPFL